MAFIKINTVEDAEQVSILDWEKETSIFKLRHEQPNYHLGTISVNRYNEDSRLYKILKYLFETKRLPALKIFKWKEIVNDRKTERLGTFSGLRNHSHRYHKFLNHGWTCKPKGGFVIGGFGMDFQHLDDDRKITECDHIKHIDGIDTESQHNELASSYYHAAKAHWLVHSIQKEGLWAPIQGVAIGNEDRYSLFIHPGSVRSCVIEEAQDENMECHFFDPKNLIKDVEPATVDEFLEYWKSKLNAKGVTFDEISVTIIGGVLEVNTILNELSFREEVYAFNKKVSQLTKKKPLNIYVGYDSNHGDIAEISKFAIEETIRNSAAGTRRQPATFLQYFEPEIKMLDISKIPEYTRPYANQSTEFTYSRFLVPYLENYEGFSIFVDNDFIFTRSLLPMFYWLHPDDAVACIKYRQYQHDTTKFDGEINIDYPCKLWSSMMIFNNGHEDCKKLTPEVVNTWTGAQLHQFEWTDKISSIPEKFIFTEGYDNPEEKWDVSGYHYTRGGPWIKNMECSKITRLDAYEKMKSLYYSK